MNLARHFHFLFYATGLVLLTGAGCEKPVPPGSLVLTQLPAIAPAALRSDSLDLRYPPGSRVVLVAEPFDQMRIRVLSEGLASAGDPVVSYDGKHVFFVGKADGASRWQIYEAPLTGGRPRILTSLAGGAMSPALLPDGSLTVISPVPGINGSNSGQPTSALYAQSPGGQPRQLTFSSRNIAEPTMLADGRILFVSTEPPKMADHSSGPALFTINNDGTEITVFAGPQESGELIMRPRELTDGRVVYLVSKRDDSLPGGSAEFIRTARPFQSRTQLFADRPVRVRSVQPAGNGELLVCAEDFTDARHSLALFRVSPNANKLGAPLISDPDWNNCEAIEVAPHVRPMGRLSTMDLTKSTGKILCLDASFSDEHPSEGAPTAARVRVLVEKSPGNVCVLGEVPIQADGSFLAEVPADVPIGFESLDENGKMLRREAPMLWLRPAENRSCIGCHEPRNRSPHNHRPLAVSTPVARLTLNDAGLESKKSN